LNRFGFELKTKLSDYHINGFYSDEGSGYVADI
jgi:hypothetical protein